MSRCPSKLSTSAIDEIWQKTAEKVGFRVVRTTAAYATSDGAGVIAVGSDETLDDDDALGQLVFHELCHAITEGEGALFRPDWGLDNLPEHTVREHAGLRVQAEIARRFGLRALMTPTTVYRGYYEGLPEDPLSGDDDPSTAIARAAIVRFDGSSWRTPIDAALAESAASALPVGALPVAALPVWASPVSASPALALPASALVPALALPAPALPAPALPASALLTLLPVDDEQRHPVGFAFGRADQTCASCAWLYVGGRGAPVPRCRQAAPMTGDGARTALELRACVRWESPVDCRSCGACCREAYHSVTVSVRDPVVWQEPALVVRTGHRFEIQRKGARCAALTEAPIGAFSCSIYEHRPRPCREFAAGGRHCLEARRRVGLSPVVP